MTSHAQLTCLCGAIKEPGTLLKASELPIRVQMCHCNPCRQTTGAMGASFPPLKGPPSPQTLQQLVSYRSSDILTRHFCSTCGCHCFLQIHAEEDEGWRCLGGIIEQDLNSGENHEAFSKDAVIISNHDYITDTLDGGIVPMLQRAEGRDIPLWSQEPESVGPDVSKGDMTKQDVHDLIQVGKTGQSPAEDDYLPAKCHCGGVSLLLKRASHPPGGTARYIPTDRSKFLTYPCACRSCRLSAGVSLLSFASVPMGNVFNNASQGLSTTSSTTTASSQPGLVPVVFGKPACEQGANPGLTLQHYWSSPDVCRSFCGKCGANVFYWHTDRKDEMDVAVGIFRAEEGVMARKWLEWQWGRCSFSEECIDLQTYTAWSEYKE